MLKTIAFYSNHRKLVASHYYACHPMSYYGDGRVSADFCGLARKQRQQQEPDCTHLYFNGCGGNIGAGKYNDGSKEMRPVLTQRILDGIVGSEKSLDPQPIESVAWETFDIQPPSDKRFDEEQLMAQISDKSQQVAGSQSSFVYRRVASQNGSKTADHAQFSACQQCFTAAPAVRVFCGVSIASTGCRSKSVCGLCRVRRRRTLVHPYGRSVSSRRLRGQRCMV